MAFNYANARRRTLRRIGSALGSAGRAGLKSFGRSGVAALAPFIAGAGDYRVRGSRARRGRSGFSRKRVSRFRRMPRGNRHQTPRFSKVEKAFYVTHTEYLTDISSSVAFTSLQYPLNPGLAVTFPWLSTVACNFNEYDFESCVFHFKTTSGDIVNNGGNGALGAVIMSTQYDALSGSYTNKAQMENAMFGASCKPSDSLLHPIECKRGLNVLGHQYVRSGAAAPNSDLRMYDQGIFQIATQGMQAPGFTIGELWVTYKVKLYKPILVGGLTNVQTGRITFSGNLAANSVNWYSTTNTAGTLNNVGPGYMPLQIANCPNGTAWSQTNATVKTCSVYLPSTISEGYYLVTVKFDTFNNGAAQVTTNYQIGNALTVAGTNCNIIGSFGTAGVANPNYPNVTYPNVAAYGYYQPANGVETTFPQITMSTIIQVVAPGQLQAQVCFSGLAVTCAGALTFNGEATVTAYNSSMF